ncbi:hypothetical protein F444_11883 [Phytophthora nicotianae P1976]|uniref:Dynein heavy chain linker domain-containing protein n=1 Tax=Phytophthora nicotianae P1976 TaxID=1317066 RepID=A0A080ZYX9_PHYNI|nr:hypothetical protein F444_11883 [Phytophthora nicotianae P1976]
MSAAASGEAQIEVSLQKVKHGWDQMEFTCVSHREQNDVFILGSLEEILMLLEDNQLHPQAVVVVDRVVRNVLVKTVAALSVVLVESMAVRDVLVESVPTVPTAAVWWSLRDVLVETVAIHSYPVVAIQAYLAEFPTAAVLMEIVAVFPGD